MCRWLVYYGDAILLNELLIEPDNSLLRQSEPDRVQFTPGTECEQGYNPHDHHLRNHQTNGDGWGIAWYRRDMKKPGSSCYKSTQPAWSDKNLQEICEGVESDLIFGHIRAAPPGAVISRENCHPFKCGRLTFMHNGGISGFAKIRRQMRAELRDDAEEVILGTTDSELIFSLILNQLPNSHDIHDAEVLAKAVATVVEKICHFSCGTCGVLVSGSSLNFALTDGYTVIATRFRNCPVEPPPALYVAHGSHFGADKGEWHMKHEGTLDTLVISSEPLSKVLSEWTLVPANHMVVVTPDKKQSDQTLRRDGANSPLSVNYFPIIVDPEALAPKAK